MLARAQPPPPACKRAPATTCGAPASRPVARRVALSAPVLGAVAWSAKAARAAGVDVPPDACAETPSKAVNGLSFCDVKVGDMAVAFEEGDICRVNFTATSHGEVAEKASNFIFGLGGGESCPGFEMAITGAGDMPPLKIGGVRRVYLTDPALGFGKTGANCDLVDNTCAVFPGAKDLVFDIELTGVRGYTKFTVGGSSAPPLFSQVAQDWGRAGLGAIPGAPTARGN